MHLHEAHHLILEAALRAASKGAASRGLLQTCQRLLRGCTAQHSQQNRVDGPSNSSGGHFIRPATAWLTLRPGMGMVPTATAVAASTAASNFAEDGLPPCVTEMLQCWAPWRSTMVLLWAGPTHSSGLACGFKVTASWSPYFRRVAVMQSGAQLNTTRTRLHSFRRQTP